MHAHMHSHAQRNEEHSCSKVQLAVLLSSQAFVKKQFFFSPRVVEEILAEFRVRMRLQLMCFGDPKNQQAVAVPGM